MLKDFGIRYFQPLLKNIKTRGIRLRRIDLHYLDSSPGISLYEIDSLCPFLEQLTICDSLVTWTHGGSKNAGTYNQYNKRSKTSQLFCPKHVNVPCSKYEHFQRLEVCKLYRVEYKQPEDWEVCLRLANNLRSLHLESSRNMTDLVFQSILLENDLPILEVCCPHIK